MCRTHSVCKDDRKSASMEALFLKKRSKELPCRVAAGVRIQRMKFEIIKPLNGECPEMTGKELGWLIICESVAFCWYGLMKTDDFARLFHIKYPEMDPRTIRDAYIHFYYTEEEPEEEGEDMFCWETILTPMVDENGVEYLAGDDLAEVPRALESLAAVHEKNPMYLPEEEEMIEFYHYGFCPSNEKIVDCIETLSALLDIRKAKKAEYLRETLEEVENGIRNLEKKNGPFTTKEKGKAYRNLFAEHIIKNEMRLLERNYELGEIMNDIIESIPFKTDSRQEVFKQLNDVFGHTHLPGNNGNTPYQLTVLANQQKQPES